MDAPVVMKKSSLRNHERSLKWEKHKMDKAVNEKILAHAEEITDALIEIGLEDRNPNVLNSLLDRAFGKARQNIGLDGGAEDKPIVFMPAVLLDKYKIKAGEYKELHPPEGEDVETYNEHGPAGMSVEVYEPIKKKIDISGLF